MPVNCWPSASCRGVPAWSGRRCPYDSDTNPDFDTVRLYRPAGSSVRSKTPASSVIMPRPPESSAAVTNTRARLTGRPVSAGDAAGGHWGRVLRKRRRIASRLLRTRTGTLTRGLLRKHSDAERGDEDGHGQDA